MIYIRETGKLSLSTAGQLILPIKFSIVNIEMLFSCQSANHPNFFAINHFKRSILVVVDLDGVRNKIFQTFGCQVFGSL